MVSRLSIGQCATLACLLEVTAPKAGNVHRGADFVGLTFNDFVSSAVAIGPAMQAAQEGSRVGETVLAAVQATRQVVSTNTNLGIILLLAPLAAVPRETPLAEGVPGVLADLNQSDADNVYRAIRLAQPGGLGRVAEMDVNRRPPKDLLAAMRAAAERDLVARQYVDDFAVVLRRVLPLLQKGPDAGCTLTDRIIYAHVRLLSELPDSLIARKCGLPVAEEASRRAAVVVSVGRPGDARYLRGLADLDFWLRSDHNRRNPGTTADLVTAGLFAGLRDEIIKPPFV